MKRFIFAALALSFAWLDLAAVPATAQNIYPYQQPMFRPGYQTPLSPYLNMLIPGNAAVNYYALVEPQFQRRQYRNVMNQTIQGIISEIPQAPGMMLDEDLNAPMQATGHPTAVNYTGSYFGTLAGQPFVGEGLSQRRIGGGGGMGPGGRPPLMGRGSGGMRTGMGMGAAGTWPNMRSGMGIGR